MTAMTSVFKLREPLLLKEQMRTIRVSKRTHVFNTYPYPDIIHQYVWREPKQFRYWLKKVKLLSSNSIHDKYVFGTLTDNWIGYGRRWRITCGGYLQVSCQQKEFDRWANSGLDINVDIREATSEAKMKELVLKMLQRARYIDPITETHHV